MYYEGKCNGHIQKTLWQIIQSTCEGEEKKNRKTFYTWNETSFVFQLMKKKKKNIKHKSVFYRNKKDDVKKFKRKCLLGGQTIKHSINYWKMKKSICFFFSFLLKY